MQTKTLQIKVFDEISIKDVVLKVFKKEIDIFYNVFNLELPQKVETYFNLFSRPPTKINKNKLVISS